MVDIHIIFGLLSSIYKSIIKINDGLHVFSFLCQASLLRFTGLRSAVMVVEMKNSKIDVKIFNDARSFIPTLLIKYD